MEEFGAKTFYLTFMPGKADILQTAAASAGTPGGFSPSQFMSQTPGGPIGGTPTGFTPSGPQQINTSTVAASGTEAISNLISWCQESQEDGRLGELEIFMSGGGFNYKKASLDVSKLQDAGDGAIYVRVNIPVDMVSSYTVFIPKKLV